MHIDLIGQNYKSIIQNQPGGTIIKKDMRPIYMKMIDPATGWVEVVKVQEEILNIQTNRLEG